MATIVEALDTLFAEKKVPVTKKLVEQDLVLYELEFTLKPTHILRFELICEQGKERGDVQFTYRYVSFLSRYEKKAEVLEKINELNEAQTGYYTLYLAPDGEIYMKSLIRTGVDVLGIYEMMIQGPAIVRHILPSLEPMTGVFTTEGF